MRRIHPSGRPPPHAACPARPRVAPPYALAGAARVLGGPPFRDARVGNLPRRDGPPPTRRACARNAATPRQAIEQGGGGGGRCRNLDTRMLEGER